MAVVNAVIKNTPTDGILVPSNKSYAVTNILVCNNGTATASFDMHILPSSTPTIDNYLTRVINNLELPAGETFSFDSEKIVLDQGDKIVFEADPATTVPARVSIDPTYTDLSATISYLEV
tara:strand:- start:1109 stop:1468 length:360 start_codon:yes stop_codon:yes gene_type:complete